MIDENLEKFDARYNEGIFHGYSSTKKEYICYNLILHNIFESAYVKVDDLKTIRIKHQETILDNEYEEYQ